MYTHMCVPKRLVLFATSWSNALPNESLQDGTFLESLSFGNDDIFPCFY